MPKSKKASDNLSQNKEKVNAEIKQAQNDETAAKEVKSGNIFEKAKNWFVSLRRRYKLLIFGLIVAVFGCILIGLLVYFLKIDAYIMPSSIKGSVVNAENEAIEKAKVCVKDKCVNSDVDGNFVLKGLKYGENEVSVSSDGFNTRKYIIQLKRGENKKDFTLLCQGYFAFKGRFVSGENKNAFNSKFFVISGLEQYEIDINPDGTFEIQNILVEDTKPRIHSVDFVDHVIDLKGAKGDIVELGDIQLIPAGDAIFRPIDWLSLESLESIEIKDSLGEVVNYFVYEGYLAIEDIEVGSSVSYILEVPDYLTKELQVEAIAQGINDLEGLEFVREGKVVYQSDRDGNIGIYRANLDGSEEEKLTEFKQYANYLTHDEKNGLIYFLFEHDQKKNENGNLIPLVYAYDIKSNKLNKISKTLYEDNNGYVGSVNSFLSGKRAYVKSEYYYGTYNTKVYIGNVDGTGGNLFAEFDYYISDPMISPNGNYMVIKGPDKTYLHNINTKDVSTIFEEADGEYAYPRVFSPDNKKLLFLVQKGGGSSDLVVRDFALGKLIQVTNTARYEESPAFSPDSNGVYFKSNRDGRTNIYFKPITGGEEKQITNTSQVGVYVIQNNLIYYMGEGGMYVIDPEKPLKAQLLTKQGRVINNSYVDWND